MQHSTGRPTKAQQARFEKMKQLGCVACWLRGYWSRAQRMNGEVHHLLWGNRRRGHDFTITLDAWHHRGEPDEGKTKTWMTEHYGPSLALESKRFHQVFGSDDFLLEMQALMLSAMDSDTRI